MDIAAPILALLAGLVAGFLLGRAATREAASSQVSELAARALAENNDRFLALAQERLARTEQVHRVERDGQTRQVADLVEPITLALDAVAEQLHTERRGRAEAHAALGEQLRTMREGADALRGQTGELVAALRSSNTRGRWGEAQLRRVVEAAGMTAHVDFTEQANAGGQRPDLVVHLAGGKQIVVDSKVPLAAYLDAVGAAPAERERLTADHAKHLKAHVDVLAAKAYWRQFAPAPEFVVMFLPVEPLLSAALEAEPALFDYAFDRKVVLATPMTLVAILRTCAYAWRQDALAANAQQVLDLGKELHERIRSLAVHLSGLGRSIEKSAEAYNAAIGTLESRVFVTARRLAELDVVDEAAASPSPAQVALRTVAISGRKVTIG